MSEYLAKTDILTKPDWFPWYVQRVKGSKAWKELKDYQFGWYIKLLNELADSDTPGFLPNEVSELWKLAGAQTEWYFRKHGGIELLARHFNRTEDGLRIYNERMLEVLHEQGKKLTRRRKRCISSILSSPLEIQNLPEWIPMEEFKDYMDMREEIKKPLTARALKIAVSKLETLKGQGQDLKLVLQESVFNRWQGLFELKWTNGSKPSGAAIGSNREPSAEAVWDYPQGDEALAKSIWNDIKSSLQKSLSPHTFDTWIKPTHGGSIKGLVLYVRVPTPEFECLGDKFGSELKDAFSAQLPVAIERVAFIGPRMVAPA